MKKAGEKIILEFEDVIKGLKYSLKVVYGDSGKSSLIFEDKPY
jgi:hypothetical protein